MCADFARDLRSDARDAKRVKDHNTKWYRGTRPSAGCKTAIFQPEVLLTGSEGQRAKVRPERGYDEYRYRGHNIVKAKYVHDVPGNYSRAKVDAIEELNDPAISRSLVDMLPSPSARRKASVSVDDYFYSFDRTESPGKPLSLDIFVKNSPRETEKFVEKEYEILDNNGDALKGRKARRTLRHPNAQPVVVEPEIIEDDGFELI